MNGLPPELTTALEKILGQTIRQAQPLSGGMVNQAARLVTDDAELFVKWHKQAPPGFFEAEADGLGALATPFRVPRVLGLRDEPSGISFLLMEHIPGARKVNATLGRAFGEQLAGLHRSKPPRIEGFGWDRDNYLGALPQANTPLPQWADFYRERRLLPQIEIARATGRLSREREKSLDDLLGRLPELLDGLPSRPSLLHGDLWSGNFIESEDGVVLIDPAVYVGPAEMELAFIELFGGFPAGMLEAYHECVQIDEGYGYRRPLHQLYPLLVHLNHFGEEYWARVAAVCRFYG